MEEREWWSVTELASYVGLTRRRILQLINEGEIKAERFGNMWLIPHDEAKKFIENRNPQ